MPSPAKMSSGRAKRASKQNQTILGQLGATKKRSRGVVDEVGRERESINVSPDSRPTAMAPQRATYGGKVPSQHAPAPAQDEASAKPEMTQESEVAPRSSWEKVEHEADQKKSSRAKAGVWLGAYERFKKRGRNDLANRALDRLSKVPGYENVAKEKREGLRKTKATAKSKKASAKSKKASTKKVSTKKAPVKRAPSKSQKSQ